MINQSFIGIMLAWLVLKRCTVATYSCLALFSKYTDHTYQRDQQVQCLPNIGHQLQIPQAPGAHHPCRESNNWGKHRQAGPFEASTVLSEAQHGHAVSLSQYSDCEETLNFTTMFTTSANWPMLCTGCTANYSWLQQGSQYYRPVQKTDKKTGL